MNPTCIRIEGGLLSPDFLERIHSLDGQKPKDFGLDGKRPLLDEISSVWTDAQTYWKAFERRRGHATDESITTITREQWVTPLLEALGYQLTFKRAATEVDGRSFAINWWAGEPGTAPPIHIVGYDLELGSRPPAGRGAMSPHGLVQDYLNRSEQVWGIVTNGLTFRLLRDSVYLTRPSYTEFDLKQMLDGGRLDEFILFYRLAHRTRLPKGIDDADKCWLERYHQAAVEQGGRIREGLRDAVEKTIVILANGLLEHPKNEALREKIRQDKLQAREFYRQLLYLIYRLLFLLVAEERNILQDPKAHSLASGFDATRFYRDNLSLAHLRVLADEPLTAPERFDDLYLGLRNLFYVLADEESAALLGLPTLNGELLSTLDDLDNAMLSNRVLLEAIAQISFFSPKDEKVRRRVNYAALDVEELGSVYESLLEYQPALSTYNGIITFAFAEGTERRSTGSYYTAPALVGELIQNALVPVMQERLKAAGAPEERKQAILSLKVLDPAAGSGHFLLAAARTLGRELAKIETGTDEPSPEATRVAVREVITHCIYGVDKNPLAVDLCKVALWLEGHAEGKPLTFLDHRIRCGDSLVGVHDLSILQEGIPDEAFEPVPGDDKRVASEVKRRNHVERKGGQRSMAFDATTEVSRLLDGRHGLLDTPDETPTQIRKKKQTYQQLQEQTILDQIACHLWTGAFFIDLTSRSLNENVIPTTDALRAHLEGTSASPQLAGAVLGLWSRYRFFHWALEFPEVLSQGGFDVVLSNPPFLGGLKISGNFGDKYRHYMTTLYPPFGNRSDLCALFYRRAFDILKPSGNLGMVATNTIGQGDTRESGLAVIIKEGGRINFARRFIKWEGVANVEVNLIGICKGGWPGDFCLDGRRVEMISSRLDTDPEAEPRLLRQNGSKAFQGDIVRGIGFVINPDEAHQLINKNSSNSDCVHPYLTGENLNSDPEQKPSRFVICFRDWSLDRAREYPDLLSLVERRVKPEREALNRPHDRKDREHWWQFNSYRAGLRHATGRLTRALARSRVSELHAIAFVPKGFVYADVTVIFAFDDDYHFALLQSNVHEAWVWRNASSLESRNRYTPSDCFDTFPFPQDSPPDAQTLAGRVAGEYHEHRRQIMLARQIGLTATYNLFHDPQCQEPQIQRLRELHGEMDRAILACYSWNDLNPEHGFWKNDRGQTRYTVSPAARREILRRLLELNQEIAEKEKAER